MDSRSEHRFRLRPLPTLAMLVCVPVLLWLAHWQLDRARFRQALEDERAAVALQPPVELAQLSALTEPTFRRVSLEGWFDRARAVLLINRSRDGQAGVELVQPFLDVRSDQWVLVNRGWLPWPDRSMPPAFETPEGILTVEAWVARPERRLVTERDPADKEWPIQATRLDPQEVWDALDRPGLETVLRLSPGPAAYRVDWPVAVYSPARHLGYAAQWFALAVAMVALWIRLCRAPHVRPPARAAWRHP